MERRLLLAIVLTFVVLTAYQWLVPMPSPPPESQTPGTAAGARGAQAPAAPRPPVVATSPATPPVEALKADVSERTFTIDNGLVRAVFSNRGGTLSSWQLSHYKGPA